MIDAIRFVNMYDNVMYVFSQESNLGIVTAGTFIAIDSK